MWSKSEGDSVFDEPHLRPFRRATSSRPGTEPEVDEPAAEPSPSGEAVWDEPHIAHVLPPKRRPESYRHLWEERARQVSPLQRLAFFLVITTLSGPVAVVTTFVEHAVVGLGALLVMFLGAVLVAPVIEEATKPMLVALAVESRPHLFRRPAEIVLCCAVSGFSFAFLENLLYLNVYIPNPPRALVIWRWTVCVLLHVGCTSLTGYGLSREWRAAWDEGRKPQVGNAASYMISAAVIHGIYNASAVILGLFDIF